MATKKFYSKANLIDTCDSACVGLCQLNRQMSLVWLLQHTNISLNALGNLNKGSFHFSFLNENLECFVKSPIVRMKWYNLMHVKWNVEEITSSHNNIKKLIPEYLTHNIGSCILNVIYWDQ